MRLGRWMFMLDDSFRFALYADNLDFPSAREFVCDEAGMREITVPPTDFGGNIYGIQIGWFCILVSER